MAMLKLLAGIVFVALNAGVSWFMFVFALLPGPSPGTMVFPYIVGTALVLLNIVSIGGWLRALSSGKSKALLWVALFVPSILGLVIVANFVMMALMVITSILGMNS